VKGRVCEISLGQRGENSYGKGGKGLRSCSPTTSQILGPPGSGFTLKRNCNEVLAWFALDKGKGRSV